MPRIPLYNEGQVQANALQTPRATALPVAGGAIAKGLLDIGVVANKMQDEADTLRAEEAYNEWIKQRDEVAYGKDGAFNLKGANVFNRPDNQSFVGEFTGKAQAAAGSISQSLSNDNQRSKFNRLAGTAIRSFGTSLSQHENKEGEAWRKSVYEGVVNTEADNIAKFYDNPEERQLSIDRVATNTRTFAKNQGLSGEQLDIAVKEATSKMHGTVINRMLEANNATAAKAYYEANKDSITEKEGKALRKMIQSDSDAIEAQDAVDNVIKAFGPEEDDEAFNLDAMAAQIRDAYKNNPEVQAKALSMLKERASERDYSIRQRDYQTKGGIWKRVIDGGRISDIQKSPEFKRLDGETQKNLLNSIEAYQKDDGESSIDRYADYWAVASNPQALAQMSDAQIFAMAPKIGTSLVKQLLGDKQKLLNSEEKVREATIDSDAVRFYARDAGLDPNNEKDKITIGEIEYRAKNLIDAEQQKLGRPLRREEKDMILKRLLVEVPVRVQNRIFPGTSVENRRLFEVKDPNNIVVPESDRQTIINALKAAGIQDPSEAQIRNGYIRLKAK
jgi:hypothetical protein